MKDHEVIGNFAVFRNSDSTEALVRCSCGCGALHVIKYDDDTIYFTTLPWFARKHAHGLRERLRCAWLMLRTGTLYTDDISVSTEDAEKLGEFLAEMSKTTAKT